MTPQELLDFQRDLGLSDRQFAEFLCIDARNLRRMKRGTQDIPRWVSKWLPLLVTLARRAPPDRDFLEHAGM